MQKQSIFIRALVVLTFCGVAYLAGRSVQQDYFPAPRPVISGVAYR